MPYAEERSGALSAADTVAGDGAIAEVKASASPLSATTTAQASPAAGELSAKVKNKLGGSLATETAAVQAAIAAKAALRSSTGSFQNQTAEQVQEYRNLSAAIAGVPALSDDQRFDAWLGKVQLHAQSKGTKPATKAAADALRAWYVAQSGRVEFELDDETGAPAVARGQLTPGLIGADGQVDKGIADAMLPRITAACGMDASSTWELIKAGSLQAGSPARELEFRRLECGVPVLYDYLHVAIGPTSKESVAKSAYFAKVHCAPAVTAGFACVPALSKQAAVDKAGGLFSSLEVTKSAQVELAVAHLADGPHLVYDVYVQKESDDRRLWIDAHSGKAVLDVSTRLHSGTHSGTLELKVSRPYVSGVVTGVLNKATIWLNETKATNLGETNYSGAYSITHGQADDTWEVYFDGPWTKDGGSDVAGGSTDWTDLASFTAGTSVTYDLSGTSLHQGRGDLFYHLNFGRELMTAAFSGVAMYNPIKFTWHDIEGCNGSCCSGQKGYLAVEGCGQGTSKFRYAGLHEFGHAPYIKGDGSLTCSQSGYNICHAWTEGAADATSYILNRLEFLRNASLTGTGCGDDNSTTGGPNPQNHEFRPDDQFPADACVEPHDTGNIFAALALEWYYDLGWRDALARVLRMHAWISGSTVMSGSSNSFYSHSLAADNYFWGGTSGGGWHFPMARAWGAHHADISIDDYYDELPGAANPALMVRAPASDTVLNVTHGPGTASGKDLALDFANDADYVWLYTYAGETYSVFTSDLCGSLDPKIERMAVQSGSESVVATYEDCPGFGNNACFEETVSTSDWLGVRVSQENPAGATGCYQLNVYAYDDVGDTESESRAIANDGSWYEAAWEEAGDADYFRVYVSGTPGSGVYLDIETCEVGGGENPDTVVTLYHEGAAGTDVASDDDGGDCGTVSGSSNRSSKIHYSVPSDKFGWYYVKVLDYNNDNTGRFKIRATQSGGDRDVGGSSRASAFAVTNAARTGRYVACDLSSAGDEDWFKVTLGEQEHVTFHTADGSADTVLEVLDVGTGGQSPTGYSALADSTKKWMRRDDDGAFPYEGNKSSAHFCAPKSGDYYVRVTPYGSSTGTYTLFVQRMGNYAPAYPAYP